MSPYALDIIQFEISEHVNLALHVQTMPICILSNKVRLLEDNSTVCTLQVKSILIYHDANIAEVYNSTDILPTVNLLRWEDIK